MNDSNTIRTALERNVRAVSLRPGVGQGTARTTARLDPGLACEVTDGPWSFKVGMTEKYGGTNAGPNPGVFGRGALASCLAIGYGMWAARLGVPVESLEVEVEADYDVRGELGVNEDVPPGYTKVRYTVNIESSAPEEELRRLAETADRFSSYRDLFARPVDIEGELRISAPTE